MIYYLQAAKADPKGKTTPAPPAKKAPSRGSATPGTLQPESRERTQTPTSAPQSPIPDADPILYKKYKEKLQAKVIYRFNKSYQIVSKFVCRPQLMKNFLKNLTWNLSGLYSDSPYLAVVGTKNKVRDSVSLTQTNTEERTFKGNNLRGTINRTDISGYRFKVHYLLLNVFIF